MMSMMLGESAKLIACATLGALRIRQQSVRIRHNFTLFFYQSE